MIRRFLLVAVFGFFCVSSSSSDQIDLEPVKDNTIFEDSGRLSNGSGSFIFAGATAPRNRNLLRRALLGFDLSDIPMEATIDSVTLTLNVSKTISPDRDFGLHRMLRDWGEGASNASGEEGKGITARENDATWTSPFNNEQSWTTPGGDFAGEASAVTAVGRARTKSSWSSPGLVDDVQMWLDDSSTNFGWILMGSEDISASAKRFDSRESGNAANRPKLSIEFSVDPGLIGDFNNDGVLDATDIDLLTFEVIAGTHNPDFDVTGDNLVDQADRTQWVNGLKNTFFGDSNLDLEFGSTDLVKVFAAGEFEDGVPLNSTWATGDWDGDRDFGTGDLVKAFQEGAFENGPQGVVVVSAVPEPCALVLILTGGLVGLHVVRREQRGRNSLSSKT